VPNAAAHRRMLRASGFRLERCSEPYAIPFGASHSECAGGPRGAATRAWRKALTGGDGVPHQAVLAQV